MKKLCTVLLLAAMFCTIFTACGGKDEETSVQETIKAITLSDFETTRESNVGLSYDVPKSWTRTDLKAGYVYTADSGDQIKYVRMSSSYTYENLIEEFKGFEGFADFQEESMSFNGSDIKIAHFKSIEDQQEIYNHAALIPNGDVNAAFVLYNMNKDTTDYTEFFKSFIQSIKVEYVYEATPTPSPTPKKTIYKEGMYKVGKDIGAGEYLLKATGSSTAYYSINSDSSGDFDSIIENDNFSNTAYITVSDGQYIELSRCTMIASGEADPQKPVNGVYKEGMYKVGPEIPAGEYKLKATSSSGYYARLRKGSNDLDSIIANDNFSGEIYLTIYEGEYLQLSNCELIVQ